MNYEEGKEKAKAVKTYDEADKLLKQIEEDYKITDRQYYVIKHLAIAAAYKA